MSIRRSLLLMGFKKAYHQGNVQTASRVHSKQVSVVVLGAFQKLVWTEALEAATAQQSQLFSGSTIQCALNPDCIAEDSKVWCRSEFWKWWYQVRKTSSFHPLDRSSPLWLWLCLEAGHTFSLKMTQLTTSLPASTGPQGPASSSPGETNKEILGN